MPRKKNAQQAWNQAESEYADLYASLTLPMFSEPMSPEDIVARMQRILKICSWFYPAYMEKGIRLLGANQEEQGMHDMRKGFELMLEHCPPDKIIDNADPILESLARLYRFDIFKFKDVDEDLIENIYLSLFDFYHFLAKQDIIEASDVDEFKKEALGMKKDLVATMHRYNAIRHDPTLDQEEKESLRNEIFEGDHFWPFID